MIDQQYAHSALTGRIIGCAMNVHNGMGCGFPEAVYQRCLAIEFEAAGLAFERELTLPLYYRNIEVGARQVDFLVENAVLVELKAVEGLTAAHYAQTLNYLSAYRLEVAVLINFGEASLTFKRLIDSRNSKRLPPAP